MSIHVCKCARTGRDEFHLRYPGMTEAEAQQLADRINSGSISLSTNLPWWRKDAYGWPIEMIKDRPLSNLVRIILQNIRKVTG